MVFGFDPVVERIECPKRSSINVSAGVEQFLRHHSLLVVVRLSGAVVVARGLFVDSLSRCAQIAAVISMEERQIPMRRLFGSFTAICAGSMLVTAAAPCAAADDSTDTSPAKTVASPAKAAKSAKARAKADKSQNKGDQDAPEINLLKAVRDGLDQRQCRGQGRWSHDRVY